jgi:hypothetical protein
MRVPLVRCVGVMCVLIVIHRVEWTTYKLESASLVTLFWTHLANTNDMSAATHLLHSTHMLQQLRYSLGGLQRLAVRGSIHEKEYKTIHKWTARESEQG